MVNTPDSPEPLALLMPEKVLRYIGTHVAPDDIVGTALSDSDADGLVEVRLVDRFGPDRYRVPARTPIGRDSLVFCRDLLFSPRVPDGIEFHEISFVADPPHPSWVVTDVKPTAEAVSEFERRRHAAEPPALLQRIAAERFAAHAKHGQDSMEGHNWTADRRYRILGEELGEVAEVLNDLEIALSRVSDPTERSHVLEQARKHLVKELIQTAAMAYAWAANAEGDVLPLTGTFEVKP